MALGRTTPDPDGLKHHSDRGSQYTSQAFTGAADIAGLQWFGRTGDAFNNAAMETVWPTIKREVAWIRGDLVLDTREEAKLFLFGTGRRVARPAASTRCAQRSPPCWPAAAGRSSTSGSILSSVGFEQSGAYVAAKHGLVGLTKTAALEYATDGIRVNAVGPGFIETPLLQAPQAAELVAGIAAQAPCRSARPTRRGGRHGDSSPPTTPHSSLGPTTPSTGYTAQ